MNVQYNETIVLSFINTALIFICKLLKNYIVNLLATNLFDSLNITASDNYKKHEVLGSLTILLLCDLCIDYSVNTTNFASLGSISLHVLFSKVNLIKITFYNA